MTPDQHDSGVVAFALGVLRLFGALIMLMGVVLIVAVLKGDRIPPAEWHPDPEELDP
jgi:protein-S-isoprenylcysteine O-methyltransferase Ste14